MKTMLVMRRKVSVFERVSVSGTGRGTKAAGFAGLSTASLIYAVKLTQLKTDAVNKQIAGFKMCLCSSVKPCSKYQW